MTDKQLTELISSMSCEEKLAQLTQLNPVCFGFDAITPLTGPDFGLRVSENLFPSIGSVLNCDNAADILAIQKKHMEEDPHRIPLLFMADIIHGFKTIFPISLAMSCSFSPDNLEEACRVAAKESAVSGIHVTFSPMADLVRDPRWGRVMESFGEDPLLTSRLCAASVKGYQGNDAKQAYRMAACVKHFAAYGAPEGGREYNTVDLSDGILMDTYMPAYKAALDAGAKMMMSSFNIINRIPATGNHKLLQETLRGTWEFDGPVISDFNSVGELIEHGTAEDGKQAAAGSLSAGVDIEMMSTHYVQNGRALLHGGQLSQAALDKAVYRILRLKNELGLYENPFKDADPQGEQTIHLCAEHRNAARRIAAESMVLLKNDGVLPLDLSAKEMLVQTKTGLTGPFADSPYVLGGWSAGNTKGISLSEGLLQNTNIALHLVPSGELEGWLAGKPDIPDLPVGFANQFSECRTVIAAVGEHQSDTGEGGSKTCLRLSPNQETLLRQLKEAGKTVIAVVFSGRPLELAPILSCCDAVLQAWFPGTESGNAISDILTGSTNPSGRLSMSFPRTVGQIPIYYNHFRTGRPETPETAGTRYVSRYLDCPSDPLYCFGYGLSYSEFLYSDFSVDIGDTLTASVTVKNSSDTDGTETVQLYVQDISASIVRPVRELKDYRRVMLCSGESKRILFTITKEMLSFYENNASVFEPGAFRIMIGRNAQDTLSKTVTITNIL